MAQKLQARWETLYELRIKPASDFHRHEGSITSYNAVESSRLGFLNEVFSVITARPNDLGHIGEGLPLFVGTSNWNDMLGPFD